MRANSQVCTLKTQLHFVEAQVLSSRQLQGEVERLSQELLMLGEVHHQLCSSLALRRKDTPTHQWDLERSVLQREKESKFWHIWAMALSVCMKQVCVCVCMCVCVCVGCISMCMKTIIAFFQVPRPLC